MDSALWEDLFRCSCRQTLRFLFVSPTYSAPQSHGTQYTVHRVSIHIVINNAIHNSDLVHSLVHKFVHSSNSIYISIHRIIIHSSNLDHQLVHTLVHRFSLVQRIIHIFIESKGMISCFSSRLVKYLLRRGIKNFFCR